MKSKPASSSTPKPKIGYWDCQGIGGCCYNDLGGTKKPENSNLRIHFTGLSGANIQKCCGKGEGECDNVPECQQKNSYSACVASNKCKWNTNYLPECNKREEECWLNFGGGKFWKFSKGFTVNLGEYKEGNFRCDEKPPQTEGAQQYLACPAGYSCQNGNCCQNGTTCCQNGTCKPDRLGWLMDEMRTKGYTGVVFDYENPTDETSDSTNLKVWKDVVERLHTNNFSTALTMDRAGLLVNYDGTGSPGGYPMPGEKAKDKAPQFLARDVPFTYNIPQLYGGYPLFYTGERTPTWTKPPLPPGSTGKPQPFTGYGDLCALPDNCQSSDQHAGNNDHPLKTLCAAVHKDTIIIPTFGGEKPPKGVGGTKKTKTAFERIKDQCERYDGKSFISWNITHPNQEDGTTGCGDSCCP